MIEGCARLRLIKFSVAFGVAMLLTARGDPGGVGGHRDPHRGAGHAPRFQLVLR
jgi:hypothetical protein